MISTVKGYFYYINLNIIKYYKKFGKKGTNGNVACGLQLIAKFLTPPVHFYSEDKNFSDAVRRSQTHKSLGIFLIFWPSGRRRMNNSSFESSRRGESNGGKIVFLWAVDGKQLSKTSPIRHLAFTLLRHFTFCSLSTDPVIRKRCYIAHWNRLVEINRTVVK